MEGSGFACSNKVQHKLIPVHINARKDETNTLEIFAFNHFVGRDSRYNLQVHYQALMLAFIEQVKKAGAKYCSTLIHTNEHSPRAFFYTVDHLLNPVSFSKIMWLTEEF